MGDYLTLVTAAQGRNFIVVGADSRGTFGSPDVAFSSYDVMQKIVLISPHVVVLSYGAGEVGDNLINEWRESLQQPIDGVRAVLQTLQAFCQQRWNQWFVSVPFQFRPVVAYIVAGLEKQDEDYSIPLIYSMDSRMGFAPAFHRYGWANGGVPIYAIYIFGRRYRPDMNVDELCGLVAYGISETATQDQRVGGAIRMMKILPTGTQELNETEIRNALDKYIQSGSRGS
jgi:20S proteasome alpha/beta subunit